ncbi:MAG: endonuclease/exonuclease/phosphatase family protein [Candidatus Brocadiia bacterium]
MTEAEPVDGTRVEDADRAARAGRFLRGRRWYHVAAGALYLSGCAGAVLVAVFYRRPVTGPGLFYTAAVPPFVPLLGLGGMMAAGVVGVRRRWLLAGAVVWLAAVGVSEEVLHLLRPSRRGARARFAQAREAFRAEAGDGALGPALVPLRVVSWNVRSATWMEQEGITELAALEADLIFLQQSHAKMRRMLEESGLFEDYETDGGSRAVLSRFPVERLPVGPLEHWRGGVWRVEVAPGRWVVCVNVHLYRDILRPYRLRRPHPESIAEALEGTQRRLDGLRGTLDRYGGADAVLLVGDFNLPARYPPLRRVTEGLKNAFSVAGYGWGRTVPSRLPVLRIDHVYVPRAATVWYAAAVPTQYSDHSMVLAEVAVPTEYSDRNSVPAQVPGRQPVPAGEGE